MHRRLFMVPLLMALLLATVAMGLAPVATTWAQAASGDHVLRIEFNSYPETLDPPQINESAPIAIGALAFEGLTRIDAESQTVPGAAASWDFSPDGLTLAFHLHEGLVYSDGSPLTAERFRYPIERACDPRTASPWAPTFFDIAGCEAFFTSLESGSGDAEATPAEATDDAVWAAARANLGVRALDDRTLEIRLVKPVAYMPTALSLFVLWPVKQELIEAGGPD
jgi:oligopeptide transport system substrate-binding protein